MTYSLRGFLGPQTWHGAQASDINHMSDSDYQEQLQLHPDNDLFHCIIYLAPGDYHRFHSPTHWNVVHRRHFPGENQLSLLSTFSVSCTWLTVSLCIKFRNHFPGENQLLSLLSTSVSCTWLAGSHCIKSTITSQVDCCPYYPLPL